MYIVQYCNMWCGQDLCEFGSTNHTGFGYGIIGPTQVKFQLLISSIFYVGNEFPTFFGNAGI